jgi:hypothetical protein
MNNVIRRDLNETDGYARNRRKKPEQPSSCSVEGCSNISVTHGLCAKHYRQERRKDGKDLKSYYVPKGEKEKSIKNFEIIKKLKEEGNSFQDIANVLGLTKQGVHYIYKKYSTSIVESEED